MQVKNIFTISSRLLFVLFIFLTSPGLFAQDVPITVESGIIPPEFNINNDTLIIASSGNPFYDMSMKKHFKKNYTGPFVLSKGFGGHSVENCRYVLYEGTSNTTITYIDGPKKGKSRNMTGHGSFYILDRKTNKGYNNPNIASPKLIKAYIKGLDEARQK